MRHCRKCSKGGIKGCCNNSRTRAGKPAAQEEYGEAQNAVRKSIREDKTSFIEGLAQELGGGSSSQRGHEVIVRYIKKAGLIKNKEGDLLEISCDRPSRREIKNGNPAHPDEIPVEAIKADIDTSTNMLYSLLGKLGLTGGGCTCQSKDGRVGQTSKES